MIHENFTIDIDIDISEEEFSIYVRDKYQITIENLLNNNCSSITDYDITMDRKKCGYILRITFFKITCSIFFP